MTTFTYCSLARNSREIILKHVHNEKDSDVNRQVVAVYQFDFSSLEITIVSNYMPLCRLYIQEYLGQFCNEIDVHIQYRFSG